MAIRGWDAAVSEHSIAVDAAAGSFQDVRASDWRAPRSEGHWSPAEIAQHLILYYDVFADVAEGRTTIRPRAPRWMSTALRWILLPHILFHRKIPVRASAPREVRPTGDLPDPPAAAQRLRDSAERAIAALASAAAAKPGIRFQHPYFGWIPPLRLIRLSAVHLDHHRRQIEEVTAPSNRR